MYRASTASSLNQLAPRPHIAAFNVPRIHSETDSFLALAFDSIARNSSGITRMRKVPTFAAPFGNGGRPTFLVFFCWLKASKLLYDCRSNRSLSRKDRRDMQDRHMAFRLLRIVCFMRPCVNLWCFRMAYKLEYLYDSFPY